LAVYDCVSAKWQKTKSEKVPQNFKNLEQVDQECEIPEK
jgi:hypothetical protein